ncbi:hypothetical protein D3C71_1847640 [compost metagenome]
MPLAIRTTTMQAFGFGNHRRGDIIANKAPAMPILPQKTKEIAVTTSKVQNRGDGIRRKQPKKLVMPVVMRSRTIPIHPLRGCTVLGELGGVISANVGEDRFFGDWIHRILQFFHDNSATQTPVLSK